MAYSPQLKARVLVESLWCSDSEAARRHGVTAASVRNWRRAMAGDEELQRLYREAMAMADGRWRAHLEDVASQTASDLASVQARLHALVCDIMDRPEEHVDEHGQTPTALDRVRIGSELMQQLRATLSTTTELLTHYAAVVVEDRDGLVADATDRTDDSPPPGSGARPRAA